ncbi:MAG: cysteine desulfurase [Acidobacteriota bacterium]|jgi:cysteine desulfurase/selenocysteine lyase
MKTAGEAVLPGESTSGYDVERIRRDFPILREAVGGKPLVYLDNAATSQKPRQVLDALESFYVHENSNVHRGLHQLSLRATRSYEAARETLQGFLGAAAPREIVFVRGATEGVNLVARSFGGSRVGEGDEVLITAMEHHSNIVPWQLLCEERGARLVVAPVDDRGDVIPEEYRRLLGPRTRMAAIVHVSNTLGTVNPVGEMIRMAHERDVPVLVDGAQAAPHLRVDVRELDADFYVISGHKMYGPTGTGVLFGKAALLEKMPPYQSGGDMIRSVTFEKTRFNDIPFKFEAGTPNIAGAVGLGAAVDYLSRIGIDAVAAHEDRLLRYATDALASVEGLRILGTAAHKAGVISFVMDGVHAHDVGTILDQEGVAVRAGHHCTQPLMARFGVPATTRASFGCYNTRGEVDALVAALRKVAEVFG